MNLGSLAIWGLTATAVLSILMSASQGLRLTRMNMPFLVGTVVTPDRDLAKWLGTGLQLINGWVFAILYLLILGVWGGGWWRGALLGLIHGLFLLTVVLPILPNIHPRMAHEAVGSTQHRVLEPPGFLGLNYGPRTPWTVIVPHIIFGAILGAALR